MPIKIVFFDKNHCVFKLEGITRIAAPRIMQEILEELHTIANINQITEAGNEVLEDLVKFYGEDAVELYDYRLFMKHIFDKFYVKPTEAQMERAYNKMLEGRAKAMVPNEDIEMVLSKLKQRGIKVALLTNSYYERALYQLNRVGLLKYFNFVVTSDLLGKGKVNQEMYEEALRLTEMKAVDSMIVSASNVDMLNGKRVGMTTVKLLAPPDEYVISMDRPNPDFRIMRISDLLNIPLLK